MDETLSPKERYEQEKAERVQERSAAAPKKIGKRFVKGLIIAVIAIAGIGGIIIYIARAPSIPETDIVARNGIHWHPQLTIVIRGVVHAIPANIGIEAMGHPENVHTHDDSGTLHLERDGLVQLESTRLKNFFQTWGQPFTDTCILDVCVEGIERVKFFVNGIENPERGEYPMKDGDKIEIRLE